ncbi:tyrosine-type recombinase/integrase [Bacillus cereus group sp. BY6-1LC]|uniref:tyrosine-type recombinase/integrase n=1 Tax=Bacillus cereus group sp. BY6-1LC TaxID=3018077 RepID=UPI0022E07610|nr:tyrosine-type recombinase/integrase [Bacillus cereus group sp. BY6-1LC]MDA1802868.1 tyrosine-type recombinase/integrase [Bacillus cereus group sp. BY6-1LC]
MKERHICEPIRDPKKVKEMLEALSMRENGFRDALLFEVGISTGLRVSDILSLKKSDISNGMIRIKTKKTSKYKVIALNDSCREKLDMYTEHMQDDQLLFPIKRQWVHKILKWGAEMIGLDKRYVSTHVMRKTAAYHFYKKTKDISKTQAFLGHRDHKETQRYIMITDEEVNEDLVDISWSVASAKNSLEIDGFDITEEHTKLILKRLTNQISEEEFLEEVRKRVKKGK